MKKISLLTVIFVLLFCFVACSKAEDFTDTAQTVEVTEEQDAKALAASLIDHPVNELYEAIGYPVSCEYTPSCLKQDGEDGNLYYDGFIVYTIRQGEQETVYYVE